MSRRKGANAEREVAKLLCAWWQQLEPGVSFVKTPLSGGWGNAKVRGDFRASGDLMTNAKTFPFTVEVKRREGFASERVKPGVLRSSPIWEWWEQALTQAEEQRGTPMLVFRKSHEQWRIILPATRRVWAGLAVLGASHIECGRFGLISTEGTLRVTLAPLELLLATNPRYWST
jgi:Holliday junction resolvase